LSPFTGTGSSPASFVPVSTSTTPRWAIVDTGAENGNQVFTWNPADADLSGWVSGLTIAKVLKTISVYQYFWTLGYQSDGALVPGLLVWIPNKGSVDLTDIAPTSLRSRNLKLAAEITHPTSCNDLINIPAIRNGRSYGAVVFACRGAFYFYRTDYTGMPADLNSLGNTPPLYGIPPPEEEWGMTTYKIGVGTYTSLAYSHEYNTLFAGTDLGIGLSFRFVNTLDVAAGVLIRNVMFFPTAIFDTGSRASRITSIFVEDMPLRKLVVFWGSDSGMLIRTHSPDIARFEITNATHIHQNLSITDMMTDFEDPNRLLLLAPTYNMGGSWQGVLTEPRLLQTAKTNCSLYTCGECIADPYCGYCYDTGVCSLASACPASSAWNTDSGGCVTSVQLNVTAGSTVGGTFVQVSSNFYNTSMNYKCRWESDTYPMVEAEVMSLAPTSVVCVSPSFPDSTTAHLTIRYLDTNWTPARNFNFYHCPTVGCRACSSGRPECGWCFAQSQCLARSQCDVSSLVDPLKGWTQGSTCPETLGFANPSVVSAVGGETMRIAVSDFPDSSIPSYECAFKTYSNVPIAFTAASKRISTDDASLIDSFTCPSPEDRVAAVPNLFRPNEVSIRAQGSSSLLTADIGAFYESFNCSNTDRCDACLPLCNWCGGSQRFCFNPGDSAIAATCTTPLATTCPTIHSISPNSSQHFNAREKSITLSGDGLYALRTANCTFHKSGFTLHTEPITVGTSDTQLICPTPSDSQFSTGAWQLALSFNNVFSMATRWFNVYNCADPTACGTCVTFDTPECVWCGDIANLRCTNTTGCSLNVDMVGTCPKIRTADPDRIGLSLATPMTLTGEHLNLNSGDEDLLQCTYVNIVGDSLGSNSNFTIVGPNQVHCESMVSAIAGDMTVRLTLKNEMRTTFAEGAVVISSANCTEITNCEACNLGGCLYCAGVCSSSCLATELIQSTCPTLSSVEPNHADIASQSPTTIIISGTGFLTLDNTEDLTRRDLLETLETNDALSLLALLDTADTTSGLLNYECSWGTDGTLLSPAKIISSTQLDCDAPDFRLISQLDMTVLLNGVVYLSNPIPFQFFTCPTTSVDYCSEDSCTRFPLCGRCVVSGMCSSDQVCPDSDLWQPKCLSNSLSQSVSILDGGDPLTVTINEILPANINTSAISCQFGTQHVTASIVLDASSNTSTVFCNIPKSPAPQTLTVPFSVLYSGGKLIAPHDFAYTECGEFKGCTKCTGAPNCGWCEATKKCTLQYKCTSGKWIKEQNCPLNVVALGVGLGLGLFFLLILALIIAFLVRRAQKKRGLVITMKEPDYDAIAWGNDLELLYKTSDNFRTLSLALSRSDFILQMAMALTCPATEQDTLAKGLVYVSSSTGKTVEMIRTVIRAEVASCLEENTLFRSNSVASKMYKFYSRIVGIKYLYHCIARVIMELETLGRKQERNLAKGITPNNKEVSLLDVTMELDIENDFGGDNIDTDTNLLQLQLICQKILNVLIKTTLKNIPTPLRQIFIEIDQSVSRKFPGSIDAVYKGLGGLFFLRFVCPAITAPHVYGLLESPPSVTTQRQLVLITKVIQSIANMQVPGKKEQYMEVMGSFIETSIPRIQKFYDNLRTAANISNQVDIYDREIEVPPEVLLNGLAATQAVLVSQSEKVKKWAHKSHLDAASQEDLVLVINECLEANSSAPKKARKGDEQESKKKKQK
jgi:hypothetical protein